MVEFNIPLPSFNFSRKKFIIANFIDETGTFYKAKKKYTENAFKVKINGEAHMYMVDPTRVYWDMKSRKPVSFYHTGDPIPLDMGHTPNDSGITSTGFKKIMEDKVVSDLFSLDTEKNLKMLLYVVAANLVITLFLVLIQLGVVKVGG